MTDERKLTDVEILWHHAEENRKKMHGTNSAHLTHDQYMTKEGLIFKPKRLRRKPKKKSKPNQTFFDFDASEGNRHD